MPLLAPDVGKTNLDGTGPVKLKGTSAEDEIGKSGMLSWDLMCRKWPSIEADGDFFSGRDNKSKAIN